MSFTDANTGTVVGDSGTILRTTNGGATWVAQSSRTTISLLGVSFTDASVGTVVGGDTDSLWQTCSVILRTTNGGAMWAPQSSGTTLPLRGAFFTDAKNGTVVGGDRGGDHGIVLHTTNGGATWMKQFETNGACMNSVSFTDGNTGTTVGGGYADGGWNIILRTTDGGANWVSQNAPITDELKSVFFSDSNTGTAVGGWYYVGERGARPYCSIIHTTDGGATWTTQVAHQGIPFNGVFFTDVNSGTVVSGSDILHTTDGGNEWMAQSSGAGNALHAVLFTDANTGTVVGDSGTILRTTNGGVTSIERGYQYVVPKHYQLSQNYPNPFNPSTTISYQLRTQSRVTLKVFDVLGREIAPLANELNPPGRYTVRWDASGVPSGVYFYRLQAGSFVNTKKLILLK
jgi:photosystem II stability/assembly factor-like uncharacterized protein